MSGVDTLQISAAGSPPRAGAIRMNLDFSPERWQKVRETYRQWWAGDLHRPIIGVELLGRDPGRPQPRTPLLWQATCADRSIPVEDLVDRLDWELSQRWYLGDAYPY